MHLSTSRLEFALILFLGVDGSGVGGHNDVHDSVGLVGLLVVGNEAPSDSSAALMGALHTITSSASISSVSSSSGTLLEVLQKKKINPNKHYVLLNYALHK